LGRIIEKGVLFPERIKMKSYRKELWFETSKRREFINITREVEKCLLSLSVDFTIPAQKRQILPKIRAYCHHLFFLEA